MKRITLILTVLLTSCGGPRIIPDERLAQIFHDIYLVDAYINEEPSLQLDSLNIYEPVFEKYGYTSDDIQFTIGSFAKRKSARLSDDVVERAMEILQAESGAYNHRLAAIDTIARRARDKYAEEVYFERSIRVRRVADTGRLRIVLPVREGSYEVDFKYMVDSTDRNGSLRVDIGGNSRRLVREERTRMTVTVDTDTTTRRLVIDLNPYPRNDVKTPALTIDSLKVTYRLPAAVAIDSMARELFRYEANFLTPVADSLR